MTKAKSTLSERECFRLGRLHFDGANAKWIAKHEKISKAEVQAAWEFCREKLSKFFAAADGEELRLLTDKELFARSEDCIRLLLHWYETLSDKERWSQVQDERESDTGDAC